MLMLVLYILGMGFSLICSGLLVGLFIVLMRHATSTLTLSYRGSGASHAKMKVGVKCRYSSARLLTRILGMGEEQNCGKKAEKW